MSEKQYPPETFSYGFELEIGDVPKGMELPEEWGEWEWAETGIVNQIGSYWGVAADPRGENPPVGGEINTQPTAGWRKQAENLVSILDHFRDQGYTPTVSCVSCGQPHVHVPGMTEDIEALKNLTRYIKDNQDDFLKAVSQFQYDPRMKQTKQGLRYLRDECGGTLRPEWQSDNILNLATDFDSYIFQHMAGKNGTSRGRPLRHAINTYCLKHTKTVEFRSFRATVNEKHFHDSFKFVERFMDAALNGGPSVKEILSEYDYEFPPFEYDHDLYVSWEKTKWPAERGIKKRRFLKAV
jgi:hypothetical protein